MKKTIFTSLSPNAEKDDIFLALRLLFSPWLWEKGNGCQILKTAIKKFLGIENVIFFESGRTCLYVILSQLRFQKGDEVLIQSFTCVAVPDAVLWAGYTPVYVDCDSNSYNMSLSDLENKITSKSKVLIIQHTFGLPAEMDKILDIAKKFGLFVIEDCAHALGSKFKNKMVGTFGHASFFSFGRDKVISSIFGGCVVTRDEDLSKRIQKFNETLSFPSKVWIFQQLLHPIITTLAKLFYNLFYIGKIILVLAKACSFISLAVYKEEKTGGKPSFFLHKMPNALLLLAINQFKKLSKMNDHRINIAQLYHDNLQKIGRVLPVGNKERYCIYLRYTIQVAWGHKIRLSAKKENIFLGDWYDSPIAPQGVDYQSIGYKMGSCPISEEICHKVVNLPTDIHIREKDALRIVNYINTMYDRENK